MRKSEVSAQGLSLHGQYILEREGKFIVEDERGYATYLYLPEAVYIENIFVLPEFRKMGVATEYADAICELARLKGVQTVIGSVKPSAHGSTQSLKVLLAYGMSLREATDDAIFLVKKI